MNINLRILKLIITFMVMVNFSIINAQTSFTTGGGRDGGSVADPPTTCGYIRPHLDLDFLWMGSTIDENIVVTITIPSYLDVGSVFPSVQYIDAAGFVIGDASHLFDAPQITQINPTTYLFTIKAKNDVDILSDSGLIASGTTALRIGYRARIVRIGPPDSHTYTWSDNGGTSTWVYDATEMVETFQGTCITAVNDVNLTPQGVTVTGNVLPNDNTATGTMTVTAGTFNGAPLTIGVPMTVAGVGTLTLNSTGSYTFDPDPAFTGTVPTITYTASNGAETSIANLDINVLPITSSGGTNNPPVGNDDYAFTETVSTLNSNVLGNDYDSNGNPITVTAVSFGGANQTVGSPFTVTGQRPILDAAGNITGYETVTAGTITINSSGAYTFTPVQGFTGTVNPITYTISDGQGGTDTATLNISVVANAGNELFAANDINVKPQGQTQSGNVTTNDSDPEGDVKNVTSATVTYTLNGVTSTQSLPIGTATSIAGVGVITLNADGTYTFVPDPTFVGNLSIPYTVCNTGANTGICDTAVLSLTTTQVQIVADDDVFTATPIGGVSGGTTTSVFENDNYGGGVDGTVNSTNANVSLIGAPTGFSINGDGTITVAPGTTAGDYTLTYQICDKANPTPQNCDTASVTVRVAYTLETLPDNGSTIEGTAIAIPNVVANDKLDGVTPTIGSNPGQVTISEVGSWPAGITLNPTTGVVNIPATVSAGSYVVYYQICVNDANPVLCKTEEVEIVVSEGQNYYAINDINQTPIGKPVNGNVLTNDESLQALTVVSGSYTDSFGVTQTLPLNTPTDIYADGMLAGKLTLLGNGSYTFTPTATFVGDVPFGYTSKNGDGVLKTASVEIKVLDNTGAGNNKPVAQNDVSDTEIGTQMINTLFSNDSSPSGGSMSVTEASQNGVAITLGAPTIVSGMDDTGNPVANAGQITIDSFGTYTFIPAAGFTGTINPITYSLSNGSGTDTADIFINVVRDDVTIVNNTFANDDAKAAPKGQVISGSVLNNDFDPEGHVQAVTHVFINGTSLAIGTTHNISGVGTFSITQGGQYVFTPLPGFVGTIPIHYRVTDDESFGTATCDATLYLTSLDLGACYNPVTNTTGATGTKHGITLLKRAGLDNVNWPMVRNSAHTVLESNTKGLVITRLANPTSSIANPVEGMMVFDTVDECLKIYSDGVWVCFSTPACP